MSKSKIIRIICSIPLVLSLTVCIVSMFTGVNVLLFGVDDVQYGIKAFILRVVFQWVMFWWLYIICIAGIIVITIMIIRNKKNNIGPK